MTVWPACANGRRDFSCTSQTSSASNLGWDNAGLTRAESPGGRVAAPTSAALTNRGGWDIQYRVLCKLRGLMVPYGKAGRPTRIVILGPEIPPD